MSAVTNDELQEKLKAATSTVIKPSFANIKVEPKEEEKINTGMLNISDKEAVNQWVRKYKDECYK